jgi:uncharacterized membrane protein YkoI
MRRVLIILALAAAPAVADPPKSETHQTKITMEKARKIALAKVPGTVKKEELEHEDGRWVFSFEIRPTGETKKVVKEVNVDADTGKIVSVEVERDD